MYGKKDFIDMGIFGLNVVIAFGIWFLIEWGNKRNEIFLASLSKIFTSLSFIMNLFGQLILVFGIYYMWEIYVNQSYMSKNAANTRGKEFCNVFLIKTQREQDSNAEKQNNDRDISKALKWKVMCRKSEHEKANNEKVRKRWK